MLRFAPALIAFAFLAASASPAGEWLMITIPDVASLPPDTPEEAPAAKPAGDVTSFRPQSPPPVPDGLIVSYDERYPAICRIKTWDSDGRMSLGSGTYIGTRGRAGYVLTVRHLLDSEPRAIQCLFPGHGVYNAAVADVSRTEDVAVLRILDPGIEPITVAKVPPRVGERLWGAGYGGDGRLEWTAGRVDYRFFDGQTGIHELSVVGDVNRFGDSGGPIINARGELCGVQWGHSRSTWNVAGVQLGVIWRLLGWDEDKPVYVRGSRPQVEPTSRGSRASVGPAAPLAPQPRQVCPLGNCPPQMYR